MFLEDDIEEAANNELVNPTETNSSDSPTEIDKTKAFATRLKEEKAASALFCLMGRGSLELCDHGGVRDGREKNEKKLT